MKKKIALLLAVLMVLSSVPAFAAGGQLTPRIPLTTEGTTIQYFRGVKINSGTAHAMAPGDVVAQRFTVKGRLTAINFCCPSYGDSIGSLTYTLYQWNETYAKTIQGKPIVKQTYVNFKDNEQMLMQVPGNHTGSFLIVASDGVQRVAVWTSIASYNVSNEDNMYVNGELQKGYAMNIEAVDAPYINASKITAEAVDAYSPIMLNKGHDESNMRHAVYQNETYSVIDKGDVGFLAYNVDFGSTSPKGASLRIRNGVNDAAKVQVIADDPDNGPIICEFYSEVAEDLDFWQTLTSKMHSELTGKHTIYIISQYSNIYMFELNFHKETPEPSWDEKRLADFEATKEFTLKDTYSDTWAGTDLLGRKLIDHEKAGDFNPDKQVGLFYWTWHSGRGQNNDYSINQRVIDSYNGPESDIKNQFNYSGWRSTGVWNESVYGIYSGYDHWVMRKHMELLSAAGVDGLFFDATNGTNVWTGGYMELAQTIHQMHLEGTPTPKMSFMLPFFDMNYNVTVLERLYESFYSLGLYSDTWYYWDGKPVVMGYPNNLVNNATTDEIKAQHEEIKEFFTFRPGQPDYRKGLYQEDQWPWLEVYPQHPYGESEKYGCECVSVGVAQNASDIGLVAMNGKDVYGRSFTYKDRFKNLSSTSKYYGYNFIEQWDRAFELNPEFVFVTGWNEWTAGHYESWGKDGATGAYPDQYSDEYSRDCEPTKGVFKDTYYLLLANKIRQFKGVRPTPTASAEKTVALGDFDAFDDVKPEFFGFKGGTEPREAYLRQNKTPVTNYTGRNDIILSKVARDSENLYFYVQTADDLTPHTDKSWMRLFINTDRKYKTGWEGYDFILNRVSPTENKAVLEKWNGKNITDWKFEKVADVDYTYAGNEMMIKIPKSLLGIGEKLDIEFKWNDNMQIQGDIMDFYNNGDTAPVSRFAYRYVDEASVKNQVSNEPVDPATTVSHITRRMVTMAIDNNIAYVYGHKTPIDPLNEETAPIIVNGKTLLPVRFLAETFGATVLWDEKTQEIKIMGNNKRIFLTLGSNIMKVEKEKRTLQTPAMEIGGRTYVPLRDIVEALEINCYWEEPGLIICGPSDGYFEILANDGVGKLLTDYNLIPDLN